MYAIEILALISNKYIFMSICQASHLLRAISIHRRFVLRWPSTSNVSTPSNAFWHGHSVSPKNDDNAYTYSASSRHFYFERGYMPSFPKTSPYFCLCCNSTPAMLVYGYVIPRIAYTIYIMSEFGNVHAGLNISPMLKKRSSVSQLLAIRL